MVKGFAAFIVSHEKSGVDLMEVMEVTEEVSLSRVGIVPINVKQRAKTRLFKMVLVH